MNSCHILNIKKLDRLLSRLFNLYLAKNASVLRITQVHLMEAIASNKDNDITSVGETLGMERTTASRNIKALMRSKLAEKIQARTDKRKAQVNLTKYGEDELKIAKRILKEANKILHMIAQSSGIKMMEIENIHHAILNNEKLFH